MYYTVLSISQGAVPGTFTSLKWSMVPPSLLYKIFIKIVQILVKVPM
jgi:hypothetical protein